jgi:hypothetical protein
VNPGRAQIVFACLLLSSLPISNFADLVVGQRYSLSFTDVDGNTFSTADERITVLGLASRANIDKARAVGERIPDFCLANPTYRMITVVSFATKHSRPVRALLAAMMRHRLDAEAQRLQLRYDRLKNARNARQDVFASADFDGTLTEQLGAKPDPQLFRVFVFGKNGELLRQWSEVPSEEELANALKRD